MTEPDVNSYDYSTGVLRQHYRFYLEDGNFVMQVEKAIFKVHRFFLSKHSAALKEILDSPGSKSLEGEGIDEDPVMFSGDNASGWELFLEEIYERQPLITKPRPYSSKQLMNLLLIAHKYCMDATEKAVIDLLKGIKTTAGYVDLVLASRVIDSRELFDEAIKGMLRERKKRTLEEAKLIGMDAVYTILESVMDANNSECQHCGYGQNWNCESCGLYQQG